VNSENFMKPVDFVRRTLLASGSLVLVVPVLARSTSTPVELWKAPQCGCCMDWVAHLKSNGFAVTVHDDGNTDARARLRMPLRHGSCHTALVGGYAVEGHVPAREIRRLLAERPKAIGLAVPGMPIGSPGMDGPACGGRRDPYDVLLVLNDGSTQVYRHYA
jgi:hypothetical protein